MKKFFWIVPLLLMAIGAFFCPYWVNLPVVAVLLLLNLLIKKGDFSKILKNLVVLFLFLLPVILTKLFTQTEGKTISLFFLTFYSESVTENLDILSRVFILSIVSHLLFYQVIDIKQISKKKISFPFLAEAFLSISLYQEILGSVIDWIKEKKFHGVFDFLASYYHSGKETLAKEELFIDKGEVADDLDRG